MKKVKDGKIRDIYDLGDKAILCIFGQNRHVEYSVFRNHSRQGKGFK